MRVSENLFVAERSENPLTVSPSDCCQLSNPSALTSNSLYFT